MFHWCSAIFALNFCHPSWPQTSSTSTVSEAPGMKAFFATMSRTPWQSNFQAKVWGDMCTKSFKLWENKIHFQNWPLRLCIPVQLSYAHVVGSGAPLEEKEEKEHVPRQVLAMWFQVCFVDLLFSQFWNSAAFVSRRILHCYVVAMLPEGNAT